MQNHRTRGRDVACRIANMQRATLVHALAVVLIALSLVPLAEKRTAAQTPVRRFQVLLGLPTEQPRSGRLFVFLSRENREPRLGPNWFAPEPFFAVEVKEFTTQQIRDVDQLADGFPGKLSSLPPGSYRAQAVFDHSLDGPQIGRAAGNFYGSAVKFEVRPHEGFDCRLMLDEIVRESPFPVQSNLQEVVYRSERLSKFFGRDVLDRCAVVLPSGYDQHPDQRYPTVYVVPGFGGDHRLSAIQGSRFTVAGHKSREFICVGLSGSCRWGHHEYADSATNGPRGESLVRELIPLIDARFRTLDDSAGRFVMGHSSGGWSSLWLQVNYPDLFGGCWSLSPDPVDFCDFQQIDVYARPAANVFFNEENELRPIARRGTTPVVWFRDFSRMDDVLGRGGQLRSFEAVFSPLDEQGQPKRLWDRKTGKVDPAVAKSWEAYDIHLRLTRDWDRLKPKLRGKLHITVGGIDTFYLEGAVKRLADGLRQIGSDAHIEIVEGRDHSSVLSENLYAKIHEQMTKAVRVE